MDGFAVRQSQGLLQFLPDLPTVGGTSAQARAGNTFRHEGEGQSVMFLDTHVEFEKRAFCGVDDDNIYTVSGNASGGDPVGTAGRRLAACLSTPRIHCSSMNPIQTGRHTALSVRPGKGVRQFVAASLGKYTFGGPAFRRIKTVRNSLGNSRGLSQRKRLRHRTLNPPKGADSKRRTPKHHARRPSSLRCHNPVVHPSGYCSLGIA